MSHYLLFESIFITHSNKFLILAPYSAIVLGFGCIFNQYGIQDGWFDPKLKCICI